MSDFTAYFSIAKNSITVVFVLHAFSILTLHIGIGSLVKKTSCSFVGLPEYTHSRQPYPQPHGDNIGQLRRRSWWQLFLRGYCRGVQCACVWHLENVIGAYLAYCAFHALLKSKLFPFAISGEFGAWFSIPHTCARDLIKR